MLYDCAGKVKNNGFDFKANLLSTTRRLAQAFQTEPDWSAIDAVTSPPAVEAAADGLLEVPVPPPNTAFNVFTIVIEYDALNRITRQTTPDGSVTVPTYNEAGMLERLSVGVRGAIPQTTVVSNIDYNARGQRVLYEYADPTNAAGFVTCQVNYTYDPFTFRLTNLLTNRLASGAASPPVSAAKLQGLLYTYDPVGNVVELDDNAATAPIFSGTTPVTGNGFYRYDSIYRLIRADGREHPGQVGIPAQPRGAYEFPVSSVPHPNDLQGLLRYKELYTYDRAGNITEMRHTTAGSPLTNWTRAYNYESGSNRLIDNNDPDAPAGIATYAYTANGAMRSMSHLPVIDWDYADRMKHANRGSGGGDVYFTYDASGQRVRKVWLKAGNSIDERIYVGGWETFRQRTGALTTTPTFERETLHIVDDQRRIAMVETKTIGSPPNTPRWRFQLTNLLGSSVMELDPQSRVITYEEYHPYGSTAFHSSGSAEISAKRYRYSGKEKDEETGLYYYGARYYVPWLGRWTAVDPAGASSSTTAKDDRSSGESESTERARSDDEKQTAREQQHEETYAYCMDSPVAHVDADGRAPKLIGHVYVIEAVEEGVKQIYTGSSAQALRARFSGHKWEALIKAQSTKVSAYRVLAEPNVAASGSGTARSAVNEALRGAEQTVLERVRARGSGVELNEAEAAAGGNKKLFMERHNVSIGRSFIYKPAGAIFGIASILDAFKIAKQLNEMEQGIVHLPVIAEDESGAFKVVTSGVLFWKKYYREYLTGENVGTTVEITEEEALYLQAESRALFGTTDWAGDFVPGLLAPEPLVIPGPTAQNDEPRARQERAA